MNIISDNISPSDKILRIMANSAKDYGYLGLDEEQFATLVGTIYKKAQSEYNKSMGVSFEKYFKDVLSKSFDYMVKEKLELGDVSVFCKYVEMSLSSKSMDKADDFFEIKKFNKWFKKVGYTPNVDFIMNVLGESERLLFIVKRFVEKNINAVKSNSVDEICDDDLSLSFIEAYCMANNIEVDLDGRVDEVDDNSDIKEVGFDDITFFSSIDCSEIDIVNQYLKEMGSIPLLTSEEQKKYARAARAGDERAKKRLVEGNLRWVVTIAKKYCGRGMSLLDLIQEGNLGLLKAVDMYDPEKGFAFSTYSSWWIRQAITRALADKNRNVRIPVYMYEKIGKYNKIKASLADQFGRMPTMEEVAEEMGIQLSEALKICEASMDTISINALVDDDNDTEFGDFIPVSVEDPEESAINAALREDVFKLLHSGILKPREIEVIKYRFGLEGEGQHTLEEVGQLFCLTRERIRQIEDKALDKLQNYLKHMNYASYVNGTDRVSKPLSSNEEIVMTEKGPVRKTSQLNGKDDKKNMERKNFDNVYTYFGDTYTEQQIDVMLGKLSETDIAALHSRFGTDLKNPVLNSSLSAKERNFLYGSVLPRMRRYLSNPNYKPRGNAKKSANYTNTSSEVVQAAGGVSTGEMVNGEATEERTNDTLKSNFEQLTREEYSHILDMIKSPSFGQLVTSLGNEDAMIVSLTLGYFENKYFSTESVAAFLGTSQERVIESTKNALYAYRDSFLSFIDKAIDATGNKPIQYVKAEDKK